MEWDKTTLLISYLLALGITTSVFVYSWRHRHVHGGTAYTWFVAGQVIWSLGYIFELLIPGLKEKIFWDSVQWFAGFFILIAFPVFAVRYTELDLKKPRFVWGMASIVPIIMTVVLLTDSQHHLIYSNPHLQYNSIYPELNYDFTWVVYGYAIYSYLVTFAGLGLLVRRMLRPHRLYARQIMTVTLGIFIPLFFTILTTAGVQFMPFRDVSILSFALGNLIIAVGLFRYKLFEVVPIVRELVVENMDDLLVVLDMQDRVVDINPIALDALGMKASQIIGQPAEVIFHSWPELAENFTKPENIKTEIVISDSQDINHYEIKSTLLHDKNNRYIGRVFVARDVTERVELQKGHENLNQELEERVVNRTEDLHKSAEQYRAVVENQTELIVRWKPDRTRTFVNEAYCRYFGLTEEQAISLDFMFLIPEEDRPAIEEKISRLLSGETTSETETHRVINPDGSIGWQEWTDQVIRDDIGEVVELQSVGRDITERKHAEDALALSEEKFFKAFNTTPVLMTIEDDKGFFVDINQAFLDVLGFKREEVIGRKASELNFVYDLDDLNRLRKAYQENGFLKDFEAQIRRNSGEIGVVSLSSDDFMINGIKHIVTSGLVITERKQAEEELRKSNERYRTLFEDSPVPLLEEDFSKVKTYMDELRKSGIKDFRSFFENNPEVIKKCIHLVQVIDVNNAAVKWQGSINKDELLGSLGQLISPSEYKSFIDELVSLVEHGTHYESSISRTTRDGLPLHLIVNGTVAPGYEDTWGRVLVSILDITEQKEAEEKLTKAYETTLWGWAKALEFRDKETEGHSHRVVEITLDIAQAMGITREDELINIRRGAILHDIGKMGIPDEILLKPGKLSEDEWQVMSQHPQLGYKLLAPIDFLKDSLDIVLYHHEKWNGSGYPNQLSGKDIPLAARIFTIVDVWDAIQTDRPYKKAWKREKAIQYLKSEAGKQFDPAIVTAFFDLVKQGKI